LDGTSGGIGGQDNIGKAIDGENGEREGTCIRRETPAKNQQQDYATPVLSHKTVREGDRAETGFGRWRKKGGVKRSLGLRPCHEFAMFKKRLADKKKRGDETSARGLGRGVTRLDCKNLRKSSSFGKGEKTFEREV